MDHDRQRFGDGDTVTKTAVDDDKDDLIGRVMQRVTDRRQ